MNDFVDAMRQRVLVCDGAMGTMLHAAGNSLDRALPELNLSNPDLVSTVHESYVDAGVDLVLTNTFGAGRLRLAEHGFADSVADINEAGVRLARNAAGAADRAIYVGGSVAPAVSASQRQRVAAHERVAALREQMRFLLDAGIDVMVLETFGYLDELVEAVEIARQLTDLPIIAEATFTLEGHTPGGESPAEVAQALSRLPVTGIGANCTVGPQGMLSVIEEMRQQTALPLSAQPNAGQPRRVPGRRFEYNLDDDYFARYARRYASQGVAVVGGCCGTTPAHVRAVVAAIADLASSNRAAAQPSTITTPGNAEPAEQDGLAGRLARREFVVAAEIAPPRGGTADEAADLVTMLRDQGIELVFVGGVQSAHAQLSSASLALHLQQRMGIEAIATVTTWDKTIMTLQADLLGAHAFGMRTVLCQTGNPPLHGDYPNADGIWDVESIGLIELLSSLNAGRDYNGLPLAAKTSFRIGAGLNPGAQDIEAEIARTRLKISAGAHFLVTDPVYELSGLQRLHAELSGEGVPILLTISALKDYTEAEYLTYEVPDVTIPDTLLAAMEYADDGPAAGLAMASDVLAQARPLVDGVVLTVRDGDKDSIRQLLTAAGLR